jgi:hypothetical protein
VPWNWPECFIEDVENTSLSYSLVKRRKVLSVTIYISKRIEIRISKRYYTPMFIVFIHNCQDVETTQMSVDKCVDK